jgi:hypothetical protein
MSDAQTRDGNFDARHISRRAARSRVVNVIKAENGEHTRRPRQFTKLTKNVPPLMKLLN